MFTSLLSCEDLDSALITLSGLSNAMYSVQMFGLPKLQQKLYFEDHVNESKQWQQWWANGLAMNSVATLTMNACHLTKAQKKTALKACGTTNVLAAGLIAKQMIDGDFKKPIGCATIGIVGIQAVACFARACHSVEETSD